MSRRSRGSFETHIENRPIPLWENREDDISTKIGPRFIVSWLNQETGKRTEETEELPSREIAEEIIAAIDEAGLTETTKPVIFELIPFHEVFPE